MSWLKKHNVLRKRLKEQGLYVRGKTFVEMATAFYEGRIDAALALPDTGEKYAALLNIHSEMQSYVKENDKLLKLKTEIAAGEGKTPLFIGALTLAAMALTAVACYTLTGVMTTQLTEFVLGMAGLGELMAVAGVITLATDKPQPDHFKKLAADESAALNGLSAKVKQKMLALAGQPVEEVPFFTPTDPLLTRLDKIKLRFLSAAQPKPHQQAAANNNVAPENFKIITR